MFNISDLQIAKNKAKENRNAKLEEFDKILQDVIALFDEALKNSDSAIFCQIAQDLSNALKIRTDRVEPYAYLSAIFYFFQEDEIAKQYYDKAKSINSNFPLLKKLEIF